MDFITMVDPKLSIISAGYNNRYHLPSNKVLKRYRHHYADLKNRVLQTHSSGAISLTLKEDKTLAFQQFRKQSLKYWHHNVQN
jgi:beta-lactamase superfamily II metal-dependent hydrolase